MIRVALAEEYTILRWALRQALANEPDLEVVGEAGTVAEALEMLQHVKPDLVLVDTGLPDSGFDMLAEIKKLDAGPLVLMFGPRLEPSQVSRAIAGGAHGYVSKTVGPETVIAAIRAVSRGEQVIPPEVGRWIASGDGDPVGALTHRELQVMEMLGRGMTNREIADHLVISMKTVDTHRGHVLKKLGLRNNSELTRFAVKHGYVAL